MSWIGLAHELAQGGAVLVVHGHLTGAVVAGEVERVDPVDAEEGDLGEPQVEGDVGVEVLDVRERDDRRLALAEAVAHVLGGDRSSLIGPSSRKSDTRSRSSTGWNRASTSTSDPDDGLAWSTEMLNGSSRMLPKTVTTASGSAPAGVLTCLNAWTWRPLSSPRSGRRAGPGGPARAPEEFGAVRRLEVEERLDVDRGWRWSPCSRSREKLPGQESGGGYGVLARRQVVRLHDLGLEPEGRATLVVGRVGRVGPGRSRMKASMWSGWGGFSEGEQPSDSSSGGGRRWAGSGSGAFWSWSRRSVACVDLAVGLDELAAGEARSPAGGDQVELTGDAGGRPGPGSRRGRRRRRFWLSGAPTTSDSTSSSPSALTWSRARRPRSGSTWPSRRTV